MPPREQAKSGAVGSIRPASARDIPALSRIFADGLKHICRDVMTESQLQQITDEKRSEYFQTALAGSEHKIWVAERDGAIAGFLDRSEELVDGRPLALIHLLYVKADCMRQGVGGALLRHVLANESGPVCLWVTDFNAAARKFYEQHGFAWDGTSKVVDWNDFTFTNLRYIRPDI